MNWKASRFIALSALCLPHHWRKERCNNVFSLRVHASQLTTRCSYFTSLYVILNIQAALFPHHFLPFNGRLDDANQMKSTFLSLLLPSSLYRARSLASALLAAPLGRLNYKEKYFRATILFPIKFGELSPRIKMGHDPRSAQRSREGKKKVHQTFNSRCWWLRS